MTGRTPAGGPGRYGRASGWGKRGLRLAGASALVLGTAGGLAAPAAQAAPTAGQPHQAIVARPGALPAIPRAGAALPPAPGLWRPGTIGHAQALPVTSPAATSAAGPWRVEPTPNPAGKSNGSLVAESCGSAKSCIAVGNYYNAAGTIAGLAEAWNGTTWKIQATVNPADASSTQLTGISCTSAQVCTAVGYDTDAAGVIVPLAETWNGTTWKIQATPSLTGAKASGFLAISCTSPGACTAVGDDTNVAGASLTLAERWNGTTWTIQTTPNPAGAAASGLFAISCPAATACTAAGNSANAAGTTTTLAEAWNGTAWKIQTTPNPGGAADSTLTGVSCAAANACTAAGYDGNGSSTLATLAEAWNGTAWKIQATPIPAGVTQSALAAVSCTSPKACTAVGAEVTTSGGDSGSSAMVTLAETWNGTAWKVRTTPSPAGGRGSQLIAVSCATPGACSTAGLNASSTGTPLPLAEGWNGTTWAIQATPDPSGAKISGLDAVSCPSKSACTAVGNYNSTPTVSSTLAETWNGTRWAIQPTPNPSGATSSYLQGLACTSQNACLAVGYYYTHGSDGPFTMSETWNGKAWTANVIPNPAGAKGAWFYGLSCTAADACTAVGVYHNKAGTTLALAERWNGTSWTIQAAPQPGNLSYLFGVSCTSAKFCIADGYENSGSGDAQPLAETWNGTSWHVLKVPLPAKSQGGAFSAVSCSAATACTATGTIFATPGGTFADRWNGTAWHIQATPEPPNWQTSTSEIAIDTVSCASATSCTATGNYTPNNQPATFAAAWNGTKWSLQTATLPPGTIGSILYGLSCTTAGCTAVGSSYGASNVQVTLAIATGT